jgi:hypothetical protein
MGGYVLPTLIFIEVIMVFRGKEEERIIKRLGGTPKRVKNMGDGMLRGKPVEVKSARKDNRFRVNKDNHKAMVRKKGNYILVKNGKSKVVSAKTVSKKLGRGKWLKDRKFPHKFAKVGDFF